MFDKINALIDKYVRLSNSISDYSNNPFRFLNATSIRFSDKSNLINEMNDFKSLFKSFIKAYDEIDAIIDLNLEILKMERQIIYYLYL